MGWLRNRADAAWRNGEHDQGLLSATFTRAILIATAIATPLAWYGMGQWLTRFAYHVRIDWTIFVVAFLSALVIAWLTVSFESIKAATTNPAKSLRSE